MKIKGLLHTVRDLFRRVRHKTKSTFSSTKSTVIPVRDISREEMEATQVDQDLSPFFTRLPLEIRLQIYREVWKGYLKTARLVSSNIGTDLRIHLYTDDSLSNTPGVKVFRHTRCQTHPCDPPHEDTLYASTPWLHEIDINPDHPAPGWFWYAWVLRIHWGKHWKCQHVVQRRWDPKTGTTKDAPRSPFLPVFLTCKQMYVEAITSFLNQVTLIFTCSRDAERFLIKKPHPYLAAVKCLEFSLANNNDSLYLADIWREAAGQRNRGAYPNEPPEDEEELLPVSAERQEPRILGKALWQNLIAGMRQTIPNLRDLEITIGGRIRKDFILAPFGYKVTTDDLVDTGIMLLDRARPRSAIQSDPWVPNGKVVVRFLRGGAEFAQENGQMVRQEPTGIVEVA
ncbi:hypothetical protein QBC38DRAFT_485461 [Podospora fimiseda]|uniref:Uncharacterized protein n=1 Tax=Podospora fimiseda TaxID=252190 RepID=A0AAN7BJB9_9PEZI|nr:hypothetical protein QBC38DRAFT_485461 [Podospora fimiseda]